MILPVGLVQIQVFLDEAPNVGQIVSRHLERALIEDFLIPVVDHLSLGVLYELQMYFI